MISLRRTFTGNSTFQLWKSLLFMSAFQHVSVTVEPFVFIHLFTVAHFYRAELFVAHRSRTPWCVTSSRSFDDVESWRPAENRGGSVELPAISLWVETAWGANHKHMIYCVMNDKTGKTIMFAASENNQEVKKELWWADHVDLYQWKTERLWCHRVTS